MYRGSRGIIAVFAGALLAGQMAFGQTSLATVRGSVIDQTGAVIATASVMVIDAETNVRRSVVTTSAGDFEVPDLKPGLYRLEVSVPGFKTYVAGALQLQSDQVSRVDVKLEVGDTATKLLVNAAPPVINLEEAKVAATVSNKTYENSPIGARNRWNPNMMLAVLPQVQPSETSNAFTISGVTGNQIEEGMDGSPTQNTVNQIHNMEDVEEVLIVTNNNSAEYPRAGYFNLVGKRGYNDFHGNLVYYFQNNALNAREYFAVQKASAVYAPYAASAGGHIVRNKTFFYAAYDGERDFSRNQVLLSTPTPRMRQGDFSELLNQSKPTVIRDPFTGAPFPGNIIPSTRLNPLSTTVQNQYVDLPNLGAAGQLTQNLNVLFPYPVDLFRVDYLTGRIDHEFSSKNHFFVRMNNRWTPYVLLTNWPKLFWTRQRYAWHQVYSDTHIFTPSLVHTFQFGWYLNRVRDGQEVDGNKPLQGDQVVSQLGLQGVNAQHLSAMGFPAMNITGYPAITVQPGGLTQNDHDRTYSDSWTWVRGKHIMKFGAELRNYISFSGSVPTGTFGSFTFNGSLTGYGYADYLLGLPYSSQRLQPLLNRYQRTAEFGSYFEDTWKLSRRLTLDLGIRWDYFGPTKFDDGLMFNWDRATGNVIVPAAAMNRISALYPKSIQISQGNVAVNPDKRNFVPRVGGAYRLSDRTVLRGGYGIYNEFFGQFPFNNTGGPFQLTEQFFNTITNGVPLFQFPNPFPPGNGTAPSQSINGYPLNASNGKIHQFNVTIEHELAGIGLRATYVGTRSYGLNYYLNLDKPMPSATPFSSVRQPFPQFVSASYDEHDGKQRYNGLTLRAHRVAGSLTFDAFWTWSANLSNFLDLENPYSHNFWNRTGDVASHRVVTSVFWDVPIGRGKDLGSLPAVFDRLLGRWQMGYVGIFATGLWFSPSYSGTDPSGTNTFGGLPDRVADGNLPANQRTPQHYFDTSAFVTPPAGRFGNSGVNILEGPGRDVSSVSLERMFRITERMRFQFLATATNLFNRPGFDFPAANVSVPGAGIISTSYNISGLDRASARRLEFRGRIKW